MLARKVFNIIVFLAILLPSFLPASRGYADCVSITPSTTQLVQEEKQGKRGRGQGRGREKVNETILPPAQAEQYQNTCPDSNAQQETHVPDDTIWYPKGAWRIVNVWFPDYIPPDENAEDYRKEHKLLLEPSEVGLINGGGSNWYWGAGCKEVAEGEFASNPLDEVTLEELVSAELAVDLTPQITISSATESCPTCGRQRVDENDNEGQDVIIVVTPRDECKMIWNEQKGWCQTLDNNENHVLRGFRQGPAFNLEIPGEVWGTETHIGADGLEYSTLRVLGPSRWDWGYWDGKEPGQIRLRDAIPGEIQEFFGACSISVGYHDTEVVNGVVFGYWWEGHNVWEWTEFLLVENYFDIRVEAEAWANQLRFQGIGGQLQLPEKQVDQAQSKNTSTEFASTSPDGSLVASSKNGSLWIEGADGGYSLDVPGENPLYLSDWSILAENGGENGNIILTDRLKTFVRDLGVKGKINSVSEDGEWVQYTDSSGQLRVVSIHGERFGNYSAENPLVVHIAFPATSAGSGD